MDIVPTSQPPARSAGKASRRAWVLLCLLKPSHGPSRHRPCRWGQGVWSGPSLGTSRASQEPVVWGGHSQETEGGKWAAAGRAGGNIPLQLYSRQPVAWQPPASR